MTPRERIVAFWQCVRSRALLDLFLALVGRNLVLVTACMGVAALWDAYRTGAEMWNFQIGISLVIAIYIAGCLLATLLICLVSPLYTLFLHPAVREYHRSGRRPTISELHSPGPHRERHGGET